MKPNGTLTTSAQEKSSFLNSKFPKDVLCDPSLLTIYHRILSSAFKVTAGWVSYLVKKLNNRRCLGQDSVNHKTLKLLHKASPLLLLRLFTACIVTGYFSTPWKEGKVVFIPKTGKDPCTTDAYRPITLL